MRSVPPARAGRGRLPRARARAFAPLARLRQEHRFQILLKGRRKAMRDAVRAALVAATASALARRRRGRGPGHIM